MKSILLLGGTGAIGKYTTKACLEKGYKVYVTSRKDRSSNYEHLQFIKGDALDLTFIRNLLFNRSFNAIVDFMVYDTHDFQGRISLLLKSTFHYVFLSSYRVYSDAGVDKLTEKNNRLKDTCKDKKFVNSNEYAIKKAFQEDILINGYLNCPNWTILRPSIIFGKNRLQVVNYEYSTIIGRVVYGLPIIVPKSSLSKQTTLTWGGDVGNMIANLLLDSSSYGEIFNASSNEYLTWKEVLDIYSKSCGLKYIVVPDETFKSLYLNPYQLQYDRLIHRICDNSKIVKLTGLSINNTKERLIYELSRSSKHVVFGGRIQGRMDRVIGMNNFSRVSSIKYKIAYLLGWFRLTNFIYGEFYLNRKYLK